MLDHNPGTSNTVQWEVPEKFSGGKSLVQAGNRSAMPPAPQAVTLVPEPIITTDLTGEDFDITNAVLRHNIHEAFWANGLGRDTIRLVIGPRMIGPGETGYPDDQNTAEVIGVNVDGGLSRFLLCIAGELQDLTVPAVDSVRGLWKTWRAANPETRIMIVT